MSPLEIKIALHYYATSCSYDWNNSDAEFEIRERFISDGYLFPIDGDVIDLKPTEKLDAYCKALMEVREPVSVWIIPDA